MSARVAIITDSTADIPPEWRARLNIDIIPAFVNFGNESFPDDGHSLPRDVFYQRMVREMPTTSAPSPGVAQEVLTRALQRAEQVVVFTVASGLSGIYNTIRLAAQQVSAERIRVIDTGLLSMGIGWPAVVAAEAVAQGANLEQAIAAAQDVMSRTWEWIAIDSLDNLRRGGRISGLVASVGTLLHIKPIIALRGGHLEIVQRVRTTARAMSVLEGFVRDHTPVEKIMLGHTNNPAGADALGKMLADVLPTTPDSVLTIDINTAAATHFGPGCVGVVVIRQAR